MDRRTASPSEVWRHRVAKEGYRDQRGTAELRLLMQDWRYGLRQFRRTPDSRLRTAGARHRESVRMPPCSACKPGAAEAAGYRDPNACAVPIGQPQARDFGSYSSTTISGPAASVKKHGRHQCVFPALEFTLQGFEPLPMQGQWASASLFGLLGVNPIPGAYVHCCEDSPGKCSRRNFKLRALAARYGGSLRHRYSNRIDIPAHR